MNRTLISVKNRSKTLFSVPKQVAICAVLRSETCRLASRNGTFRDARRHEQLLVSVFVAVYIRFYILPHSILMERNVRIFYLFSAVNENPQRWKSR